MNTPPTRVAAAADRDPAAAAVAEHAANAADLSAVFGVFQLGDVQAALSVDMLREVIPCPRQFSGLPAAAPGLMGAVSVRGQVVPVVDLRVTLGHAGGRHDGQVVVLMRHDGRLLGLLTDGVRGLTRLPAAAFSAMDCDAADADDADRAEPQRLLFTGSFERSEDASVVSVLDAAALLRLPGVPLLRDALGGAADGAVAGDHPVQRRGAAVAKHPPLLLLRCGAIGLAVDVTDVHATLPLVTLLPSSLDGSTCRGVVEYAGIRIPAVDPLALLALGALPPGEPCQALLLRYATGQVALLVSEVIDIVRVPAADLLPLPPLAVRRTELFGATLHVAGRGEHLVLARGVLHREPALLALASLNTRPSAGAGTPAGRAVAATGAAAAAAAAGSGIAVITYDVGVEAATRLTQVSEVLPLPAEVARPASVHPAVTGLFTCRGRSVTLLCLPTLLGGRRGDADGAEARVLIVKVDGLHFGFVVPRLCQIDQTVWQQPTAPRRAGSGGGAGGATGGASGLLGEHALVEIGAATQRRMVHLIDLQAIARRLLEGSGHPPADVPSRLAKPMPAPPPVSAAAAPAPEDALQPG